ncbi:BCCT family transporter [Sphingobacterium sp. E70]|nr:BCCT family transporter [Sphingobacterium sp. E70]ULT25632.1 BCCT family transporter [Sphingobacterium sp. E70]
MTSADSGIFVMNSIATKNAMKSPKWQMVFWGALLAILALMLLNTGGLQALQTMTLITALPFSIIMLLFCVSLVKALVIDSSYYERDFSVSTVPWSGEFWKDRLKQIVSFKSRESVDQFIETTVGAAFEELQAEFKQNDIEAKIKLLDNPKRVEIEIRYDLVNNFIYGVKNQVKVVSDYVMEEENLPDLQDKKTYFPKSYFGDARDGYDVQYFTKNELISDVLKHYERFLEIISEEKMKCLSAVMQTRK